MLIGTSPSSLEGKDLDIKQMIASLGTGKVKEIASLGGGGNKARNERAAAIAAILESRSKIKDEEAANNKQKQSYSVVDDVSASVHGRSAEAAKAGSIDKTAARIAMHMAGDKAPVNSRGSGRGCVDG